jgi:hypothetical protein
MKVEYPIELFNNFNKSIWTNKNFSYFLIAIIICYTVLLRLNPDIYYKYLFNPIVLIIIIGCILLITIYNIPLGFMLIVSLIALYYPNTNKIITHTPINIENFENEKIKVPIPGEDKNIIDDKKLDKKKKDEDDDEEEHTLSKESFEDEKNEIKDVSLEKLNPGYYTKKKTSNDTKKSNNKTKSSLSSNNKTKPSSSSNNKTKPTSGQSETFLGDVRDIMRDLDTGKNGINAFSAVKKINNLFYNKHKNNIKKMIEEEDDDSDDDSEDDDFF